MSNPAIRVENLSKQYHTGAREAGYRTFRETVQDAVSSPIRCFRSLRGAADDANTIWALKDITFEIQPGKVVGVIGRNGAGKSTLLKVLSRITEPTRGCVEIRGRVVSLLEVGTGFHAELTGRENIYLNGAILGMTRREIERKFDEIVAFAEVDRFIDTPVKRYSSGMYLRLAFAVAAHLEPEIMVVDEVLAVGDAQFQKKCLGKMGEVSKGGRTVLLVSHNMPAIEGLCASAVWLDAGSVASQGASHNVVEQYLKTTVAKKEQVSLTSRKSIKGSGEARFIELTIRNNAGDKTSAIPMGTQLEIEVLIKCDASINDPTVGFLFTSNLGTTVLRAYSYESSHGLPRFSGLVKVRCIFPVFPLMPGLYGCNLWLSRHSSPVDYIENAMQIEVLPADVYGTGRNPSTNNGGVCYTPHYWEIL